MQDKFYSIHSILDIIIDSTVSEKVIKEIDFQIAYFKATENDMNAENKIIIKTYKDFKAKGDQKFETFHMVRGVVGEVMDNPARRIAVIRDQHGFLIFADKPFLINLYIQILLNEKGISLVHAAAVSDSSGDVILFPGAGGVGKTTLLGYLLKKGSYRTLGDDIIGLTEDGNCLSFPRSFVIKDYHRDVYPEIFKRYNLDKKSGSKRSIRRRFKYFIKNNAPFKGVLRKLLKHSDLLKRTASKLSTKPYLAAVPIKEIFGHGSVINRGRLSKIVYLQRYEGDCFNFTTVDQDFIRRRMFSIILHEWVDFMREFFTLGALDIIDLEEYFIQNSKIMNSAIRSLTPMILWIPNNSTPEELSNYFNEHIEQVSS